MKITKETFEKLCRLKHAYIDDKGREIVNPKPMVFNTDLDRPPTLQEQIKRVLQAEVSLQAQAQGLETFEESQDFEIDDGFDVPETYSGYEILEEEILEEPEPETEKKDPPAEAEKTDKPAETEKTETPEAAETVVKTE